MIVYVNPEATDDQRADRSSRRSTRQLGSSIEDYRVLRRRVLARRGRRLFAGDPTIRVPAHRGEHPDARIKVVPRDGTNSTTCVAVDDDAARRCPTCTGSSTPRDQVEVVSKVKSFVGLYTLILSILLLLAAILLIWNTIRTAMFARRREIEVMKLVGATDWFIRVPFMLEGLIQGLVGGARAPSPALWLINNRWTAGVEDFPADSGFEAMVVDGDFQATRDARDPASSAWPPARSAPASPPAASSTCRLANAAQWYDCRSRAVARRQFNSGEVGVTDLPSGARRSPRRSSSMRRVGDSPRTAYRWLLARRSRRRS